MKKILLTLSLMIVLAANASAQFAGKSNQNYKDLFDEAYTAYVNLTDTTETEKDTTGTKEKEAVTDQPTNYVELNNSNFRKPWETKIPILGPVNHTKFNWEMERMEQMELYGPLAEYLSPEFFAKKEDTKEPVKTETPKKEVVVEKETKETTTEENMEIENIPSIPTPVFVTSTTNNINLSDLKTTFNYTPKKRSKVRANIFGGFEYKMLGEETQGNIASKGYEVGLTFGTNNTGWNVDLITAFGSKTSNTWSDQRHVNNEGVSPYIHKLNIQTLKALAAISYKWISIEVGGGLESMERNTTVTGGAPQTVSLSSSIIEANLAATIAGRFDIYIGTTSSVDSKYHAGLRLYLFRERQKTN